MIGIGTFEPGQSAYALCIVIISPGMAHRLFQSLLASMAKRRMTDVMGETESFGQVLIEAKFARNDAPDLCDLDAVREAGAIVIAVRCNEDLGLGA